MVRYRKNESTFAALIEMASLLPWWVGLALAGISYVALHWYAGTPVSKPLPGQVAVSLVETITRAMAGVFQYVLPVAFLVGAIVSALNAGKRKALRNQVAKIEAQAELQGSSTVGTEDSSDAAAPLCPKCGGGMIKRIARQGTNAGHAFWGCSAYPTCRGTRTI